MCREPGGTSAHRANLINHSATVKEQKYLLFGNKFTCRRFRRGEDRLVSIPANEKVEWLPSIAVRTRKKRAGNIYRFGRFVSGCFFLWEI